MSPPRRPALASLGMIGLLVAPPVLAEAGWTDAALVTGICGVDGYSQISAVGIRSWHVPPRGGRRPRGGSLRTVPPRPGPLIRSSGP